MRAVLHTFSSSADFSFRDEWQLAQVPEVERIVFELAAIEGFQAKGWTDIEYANRRRRTDQNQGAPNGVATIAVTNSQEGILKPSRVARHRIG